MDKVAPPSPVPHLPAGCRSAPARFEGRRRSPRQRLASRAIMALACLIPIALRAQPPALSQSQVEAAYIYNFGKFVQWPAAYAAGSGRSFAICAFAGDPFAPVLQSILAGRTLQGNPVVIRSVAKPQQATGCRILFIGSSNEDRLKDILTALDHTPVLTVSDIADFSRRGGMIEFVMENNYIRFAINRTVAEDAGLALDSDLLKVAVAVWQKKSTGGR